MITNAADYRYITNPQPITAGIRGGILPARDGTASACIETYEDYCYLVEMARERQLWSHGNEVIPLPIADDFDQTCLVAEETPLEELAIAAAGSPGGIFDISQDGDSALIGKDAVMTGQTFYGRGTIPGISQSVPYYAFGQMQSILGAPRATPSNYALPHIVEAETLRYLYYDLGNMKRYLFRPLSVGVMTPSEFAAYAGPSWGRHALGPVSDSDSSFAWPYYGEIHEKRDGSWRTRVDALGANLTFYIKAPFWKNPSGTAYYSTVTPYTHWTITVGWWDPAEQAYMSGTGFIIASGLDAVQVSAHSGAHDDIYEGKTTLSFAADGQYMRAVYTLAKTWVVNQIGLFDDDYDWDMDVQLNGVYLDTGAIDHVSDLSDLPSPWTWQPS